MKNFLLLIGVFFARISFAQLQFQTDRVFFQNQYISKVSVGLDSNVWVIKNQDSTEIGQVTSSFVEIDHSTAFHQYSSSKFNDVLGLDSGIVYVGSQTDYIIRFQNGSFKTLNEINGVANPNVNSIIYSRKLQAFIPIMPRIFIGTDSGEYVSSDRYKFKSLPNPDTSYYGRKVKFIVRNTDYNYLHVDLEDSLNESNAPWFKYRSLTYCPFDRQWGLYTPIDSPPKDQIHYTSITLNFSPQNGFPVGDLYWGTSYGLMKKPYSLYFNYYTLLRNRSIYTLYNLRYFPEEDFTNLKVEDCYLFAGSDSGLYYCHVNRNEMSIDTLLLVPNTAHLHIYDIDADFCNNALWLATDQGLVRILLEYQGDYTFPPSIRDYVIPSGEIVFCPGDKLLLSGPPMDLGFQWLKNNIPIAYATSQNYTASSPGAYRIVISKNNICWHLKDTTSAIVLDPNQVSLSFVHPDTIHTCGDYPVPLTVNDEPKYSYQWFRDGTAIPGDTLNQTYVFDEGFYNVRATNCNGISKNSDSIFIKTHIPVRPVLYKGVPPPLCQGDTIWLGPVNEPVVNWYKDYNVEQNYHNQAFYPVTESGIYIAEFLNNFSCIGYSDTLNLMFHPIPNVKIETDKKLPFCENDTLLVTAVTQASKISWSNGEKGKTIIVTHSGSYTVSAEQYGCWNSDTLNAVFYPVPYIDLGKDTTFCEGKLIPIVLHGGKGLEKYIWNDVETMDSLYHAYHSGTQKLMAFNSFGCSSTDKINIYNYCDPYFIPNLITPNGDTKNDKFEIINILPHTILKVYDRWGGLVYADEEYSNDWSPEEITSGIYFYYIKSSFDNKEWKGWMSIIK